MGVSVPRGDWGSAPTKTRGTPVNKGCPPQLNPITITKGWFGVNSP